MDVRRGKVRKEVGKVGGGLVDGVDVGSWGSRGK